MFRIFRKYRAKLALCQVCGRLGNKIICVINTNSFPCLFYLICHRPRKGEAVLLITSRKDLKAVLKLYRKRWSIETAFAWLKSRGFNLEDTHLTKAKRLELLLGVLAVCLCWALWVGLCKHRCKPIKIKKHGRRAISIFRLGLDHLQHIFYNIRYHLDDFRHACT